MYDEMIEYVRKYFDNPHNPRSKFDRKYPFRNNFEHCVRVYKWALRINKIEQGDEEVIAISAIFHDVGKAFSVDYDHADISADICKAYLKETDFSEDKINKIVQAIKVHPYKDNSNRKLSLEEKILIDADLLDEVGALTAVWDSMATAMETEPDYNKVYNRTLKFYSKVSSKKKDIKTETGMLFYEQRLRFLLEFIDNLGYELGIENK